MKGMKLTRNIRTAYFYARKDIMKDLKIFFFIVIAITFASANIIIMNGFMDGWRDDLVESSVDSFSGHINLYPDEGDRFIEGLGIKEKMLDDMDHVTAYSSRLHASGTLLHEGHSKDVKIIALDPLKDITSIQQKLDSGRPLRAGDNNRIIISFHLSNDLGIQTGEHIPMIFENGNTRTYSVSGILHTGSPEFDSNSILINRGEANRQIGINNKASIIMVNLVDMDNAREEMNSTARALGIKKVKSWDQEVENIVSAMNTWKMMTNTIIAVGLVAAAISVGVILYVDIQYKKRQIGVMKAIGARNSVIFSIFMIEALMLGVVGISSGSVLGFLGVKYLEANPYYCPIFNDSFGARFYPYLIYQAVIITMFVLILAGLYPAIKASKLNIIKSIWGE